MKNETIIPPHLDAILTILARGPADRLTIAKELAPIYRPGRATLLRQLNRLIKRGHIIRLGRGPATTYRPTDFNPLLVPPQPRDLSHEIPFNQNVFSHLHHLFTPQDKDLLKSTLHSLSPATRKLGPTLASKERIRWTIDFSWKSSAIEGNSYTLPETATLLTAHSPSHKRTSFETQMIINHQRAVDHIWDHPPRPHHLTVSYVLRLHAILTQHLGIRTGIRQHPVGIGGSSYLPLSNKSQISKALTQTLRIINSTKYPVEQALIAILMLSYLQPFEDGNKRTARLVGNALLLAHDLIPVSFRHVSESEFLNPLVLFYEQNTIIPFKQMFLSALSQAHSHYFRTN